MHVTTKDFNPLLGIERKVLQCEQRRYNSIDWGSLQLVYRARLRVGLLFLERCLNRVDLFNFILDLGCLLQSIQVQQQ